MARLPPSRSEAACRTPHTGIFTLCSTGTTTACLPTGELFCCDTIEIWFFLFFFFFSSFPCLGFNSLVGGIMGFSILLSAEVFKHNSSVWYLDGSIGVLIGLTIFAYGIK